MPQANKSLSKRSVLLVDDSNFSLQYLERNFREKGLSVYSTCKDREAFAIAKRRKPHVICTDVLLHRENNFAFFRALFKDPDTNQIPIIFFSAENDLLRKLRSLCQSESRNLSKPIGFDDLYPLVVEMFEGIEDSHETKSRRISLFADLKDFNLLDIYQLMVNSRQTMSLNIRGPHGEGKLFFQGGRLVDAIYHKLAGVDAAYEVLIWNKGKVTAELLDAPRTDRIQTSNEAVMLEALRRIDSPLYEDSDSDSSSEEGVDFSALSSAANTPSAAAPTESDSSGSQVFGGLSFSEASDSIDVLLQESLGDFEVEPQPTRRLKPKKKKADPALAEEQQSLLDEVADEPSDSLNLMLEQSIESDRLLDENTPTVKRRRKPQKD